MTIDLPTPLAVVCHDAGATNLILPWIGAERPEPLLPVMEGPAAALWAARFEAPTVSLQQALDGAAAVLTGSGWASDLEHQARKAAKARNIRAVAVIDHWVNYRDRFIRGGGEVLPDEMWVTDEFALAFARDEFPGFPIRLKPNLYLEEQSARAPPLTDADSDVLFVAEPVRADWGNEFQALDYFLGRKGELGIPEGTPVRIRPHPAEPPDKYDAFARSRPGVTIDRSADLASALGGARWVAGLESHALIVALHSGRTAISALPPSAPPCRLPHGEIVRLATL